MHSIYGKSDAVSLQLQIEGPGKYNCLSLC